METVQSNSINEQWLSEIERKISDDLMSNALKELEKIISDRSDDLGARAISLALHIAIPAWYERWDPSSTNDFFRSALENAVMDRGYDKETATVLFGVALEKSSEFWSVCAIWKNATQEMKKCEMFARWALLNSPLLHQRGLWENLTHYNLVIVSGMLLYYAPLEIKSDRELMIEAISRGACPLDFVAPQLQNDVSFLETVLEARPSALPWVTHEMQLKHRDLMKRFVKRYAEVVMGLGDPEFRLHWYIHDLLPNIAPELWSDRDFVFEFFRSGCPYWEEDHPDEWKMDKDILLIIAENCRKSWPSPLDGSWHPLQHMDPSLRKDSSFVKQCLQMDPCLLCDFFSKDFLVDFDKVVFAFAESREVIGKYYEVGAVGRIAYHEMVRRVNERLEVYAGMQTLLCAMHVERVRKGRMLALLNQGEETSHAYKKRFVEYLDVPTGSDLSILRRAAANLADYANSLNEH